MEDVVVPDLRYEELGKTRRGALERAQLAWLGWDDRRPWHCGGAPNVCGQRISRGPDAGRACQVPAGAGTDHEGWGRCRHHGGRRYRERAEAGWIMAHAYAQQLNISPWDALLQVVRICAGKVAYTEKVLAEAADDRELDGRWARDENGILVDPTTGEALGVGAFRDRSWWVAKNEYWTRELAKVSKMAIDAGVAERMVEAQVLQVQLIARPIEKALAALELTTEQETRARAAMRRELVAIETEQAHQGGMTLDGTGWFKDISPEDL